MLDVFLLIMLFLASFLALIESARAWKIKGVMLAIGLQGGLVVGVFVFAALVTPIPYALALPVITGGVLFRKAQTARMMQIAMGEDAPAHVIDVFE